MNAAAKNVPIALAEVLAYRHPGVVRRYAAEHGASREEAEEVFGEMLKWLYLCYRTTIDLDGLFLVAMLAEMERIDWMWHTFVLFTRDYAAFCERMFGFFIHHTPTVESDAAPSELPSDDEAWRFQLTTQLTLVYDVLGEETLARWHDQCRYAA